MGALLPHEPDHRTENRLPSRGLAVAERPAGRPAGRARLRTRSRGLRSAHAPAQPPPVPRDAQCAARLRRRRRRRAGDLPAGLHPARQLPAHRALRRLADARGAQRGADDAPARAQRHGIARRDRRRGAVGGRDRASETPTAEQFVEAAHARALLEHAIDALPENFRMVFVLRVVEGLDVRETAECLGSTGPRCARACSARSGSCAPTCRAVCRARARRSSISARIDATASWSACSRGCRANYVGNAQSEQPQHAVWRVPAASSSADSSRLRAPAHSGASSSSGMTGERFTVSSTMDEVTSRTPATRSRRRMVKSDSASMSRTITCNRKSISPVIV